MGTADAIGALGAGRRWAWTVAVGAGLARIADALSGSLSPDSDDWDCNSSWDYGTNALDAAAFFLTAAAVLVVHAQQRHRVGTPGQVGAAVAAAGCVAAGVNNPVEHCGGVEVLVFVLWVPAILALLGGHLLLGVATIRARVLPVWAGAALIVGVLTLFIVSNGGGAIVFGIAWVAVGAALWAAQARRSERTGETLLPPV